MANCEHEEIELAHLEVSETSPQEETEVSKELLDPVEPQRDQRKSIQDSKVGVNDQFHKPLFVPTLLIQEATLPTLDCLLDFWQVYFWFAQGEKEIALISLAFIYIPAFSAAISVFSSLRRENQLSNNCWRFLCAGKTIISTYCQNRG